MTFDEFLAACPVIAQLARDRFTRDQLVMLGTLRKDGWPRISPCEVDLAAGQLFLGMMWQSMKAIDLLRDPRVVVHSVTCNKEGTDGDIKLYGRALDIQDPDLRRTFQDAIRARIDWAPEEPEYHLFAVDIERASYIRFENGQQIMTWDTERGLHERTQPHG
ncbi:MAG: pyridoxamine 5'-phosphate oxidase family protein [bacterium]